MAFGRAGDDAPRPEEDIQIGAGSGMVQHATVHGGGEEERAFGCERRNRQEIIRLPRAPAWRGCSQCKAR